MDIPTCLSRNGDKTFSIAIWATAPSETKPSNGDCFCLSRDGARVAHSLISTVMGSSIAWLFTTWISTWHTLLTQAKPANASGKESLSCAARAACRRKRYRLIKMMGTEISPTFPIRSTFRAPKTTTASGLSQETSINDGWPDIFVACDSTASLYYHNVRGKVFEEIAIRAGLSCNEDGREQAGMVAAADFDGDGLLDIFKTNFADDTHTMYRNQGGNNFEDDTIGSGLAVNTKYLGWGTAFLDFDNDGWKDLIVANGHVYPEVDTGHTAEKYKQPRLLYWNRGDGQVFDLSAQGGPGITDEHSSRGLAVGDLDNDGSEEVVISNMGEAPSLLKNFASSGNSQLVRALTSGRDAIGARITVTAGGHKQIDEVRSGGSYMSQNDLRLHFGLGSASTAEMSIRWLDGKVENLRSVAAGEIVTIEEGKGVVRKQPYSSARK